MKIDFGEIDPYNGRRNLAVINKGSRGALLQTRVDTVKDLAW